MGGVLASLMVNPPLFWTAKTTGFRDVFSANQNFGKFDPALFKLELLALID